MASHPASSYEPYRHVDNEDSEHAEKLLAPGPGENSHSIPRRINLSKPRASLNSHVRTFLRALALLIAASVLSIQAYTAFVWTDTRHDTYYNPKTGLRTRSWAALSSWPTFLMLGVGAFATVIQLLALTSLCSCFRGLHDGVLHSIAVYFSAIAVIAAWIAGVITFRVVFSQGKNKDHWDIWSWSCHRGDSTKNVPWKSLCIQQNYTFAASILAVVVEVICVALFIASQRKLKSATFDYRKAGSSLKSWVPRWNSGYKGMSRS